MVNIENLKNAGKKLKLKYSEGELEMQVGKFLERKFRDAARIYENNLEKKNFIECLKEVWQKSNPRQNSGLGAGASFYIDDENLIKKFPDICAKPFKIKFYPEDIKLLGMPSYHGGAIAAVVFDTDTNEIISIDIDVTSMAMCKTKKDVNETINSIIATTYHECDHLTFHPETSYSSMDVFSTSIKYYCNPAEIRAFSKTLAYTYYNYFKGEKFNYQKLKQLMSYNFKKESVEYTAMQFIDFLGNPSMDNEYMTKKFKDYKDIMQKYFNPKIKKQFKNTFLSYMNYITLFLYELNNANQ